MSLIRQHTRKRMGHGGFTLIELLAVVVLMGILMTIGLMSFKGVQASQSEIAVDRVATVLRHARQYAISNNRMTYVLFPHDATTIGGATTELTARKRYLRSFAVYSAGEGLVRDWEALPDGIIFLPATTSSGFSFNDNVLNASECEEDLPYPNPNGATLVSFQALKFKPDGTAPYSVTFTPSITIAEGFTNGEAGSGALSYTETTRQTYYTLEVQRRTGEITYREDNN